MNEDKSTLLVCTVGGTPEPVVASLKHWKPQRVIFVPTHATKGDIETKVLPEARKEGIELDAGRYDLFELPDGQDLASCLDRLRQLTPEVKSWRKRGDSFRVVVDFTGGTKCMSAAIALHASRWPCLFSYVGGIERNKQGVGTVVSGSEKVVHQENPWDALGYQAVEDFIVLFDQRVFVAAANVAAKAKEGVSRHDRKREFSVLEHLAKAFDAWDRFDHEKSHKTFKEVEKAANDLRAVLGTAKADQVLCAIEHLARHLEGLYKGTRPTWHHVVDLLANAKRRKEEGRLDDAVARLYRAIEAIAQLTLRERHGIENTEKVALDRIPEPLQATWAQKAKDGVLALGLQDAYALLAALGDPLGQQFQDQRLDGTTSPLIARNRSILAHGFDQVSDKVFDQLWSAAISLANITESDLPSFVTLGDSRMGEH